MNVYINEQDLQVLECAIEVALDTRCFQKDEKYRHQLIRFYNKLRAKEGLVLYNLSAWDHK